MNDPLGSRIPRRAEQRGRGLILAGKVAGVALLAIGMGLNVVGVPVALWFFTKNIGASGIADPALVSSRISQIIYMRYAGVGLGLAGLVVLAVSLVAMKRRERGGEK